MNSPLPSLLLVLAGCAAAQAPSTAPSQIGAAARSSTELAAPAWAGPFETVAAAAAEIRGQNRSDSALELPHGSSFLEGHRLQGAEDEDRGYQVVIAIRTERGWYSKTWNVEMACQHDAPTEEPLVEAGNPGHVARVVIEVSRKTECDREEGYEAARDYVVLGTHDGEVVELGSVAVQESHSFFSENTDPDEGMWNTVPVEEEWSRIVRFEGDVIHLSAAEAQVFVAEGESEPEGAREIQNLSAARTLTLQELAEARRIPLTDGAPVWGP